MSFSFTKKVGRTNGLAYFFVIFVIKIIFIFTTQKQAVINLLPLVFVL